ncbi:MAG: hypothetical protein NTW94_08015 [Legionellales bacterium]|nr:hypothetical protein [Legionellales bacterium]
MPHESTYVIQLFGGLRQYSSLNPITLAAFPGDTVQDIKTRWLHHCEETIPDFDGQTLIESAVLANETRIFSVTEPIQSNEVLAFLPPVCGG